MAKRSSKKKEFESLWERVKNAEAYHRECFVTNAENDMALLRGSTNYLPRDFDPSVDIINPNLIFSTIRNYIPALIPSTPEIFVRPEGSTWITDQNKDHVYSAFVAQSALSYYQRRLRMKKEDSKACLGALVHGLAYVMDSWVTEISNLNPSIVKDQPMHRFVSAIDLIPDSDGIDFEDKSFVVRTYGKRYDQMKKMGYKGLEDKNDDSAWESSYSGNGYDPKTKQPILPKFYEIWDKNTETVYVATQDNGEGMLLKEIPFEIKNGFPFTPLILNPMIDNFYPMSLVGALREMQKFITLMVSYGAKHAKMSVPKYVGWDDYLSPKAKRALASGKILDYIGLSPKGDQTRPDVRQVLASMQQPGLPPDYYNMLNVVRDFLNVVSGISEAARGGNQRENTATGVAMVESYLRSRIGDYKEITNDFMAESRLKLLKVIAKNAPKDNYLRFHRMELEGQHFFGQQWFKDSVASKEVIEKGQYFFIPWRKEDIDNEYEVEVGVGAGLPLNQEARYKKALQDYNIMVNDPLLNKAKVRIHFLREIGVPDPEAWIVPPPEPAPDKPKVGVNVSFKAEELSPEVQTNVLTEAGLFPKPPAPMPGPGVRPGPSGSDPRGVRPVDVGLQRELGLSGGIMTPPNMPEFSGA